MDAVLSLIRQFEGFRETPYWDVNALRTGYGSDTITLPDGTVKPVTADTYVSRDDAERDLQRRVQTEFAPRAAKAVGEEVFAAMSPQQQAALVSITYNYGSLPSSVAEAARTGDPQATAAAIRALGTHNGGVNAKRREKEAAVFLGAPTGMEAEGPGRTDRNPARLAWAYANGRMTPEDAAIYERGMQAGIFPKAQQQKTEPGPLDLYAAQIAARRNRQQPMLQSLNVDPVQNATPLSRFQGLG
jgi:GH24 family phage-related lysozyme (muramidase)